MPTWFGRNDWQSVLDRWTRAGLVNDETAQAIRAWEAETASRSSSSRLVDALSYLGVSIVLVGALMLVILVSDGPDYWPLLPFAMGVVAVLLSWTTHRFEMPALSDGFAAASVALIAVALGFTLDEIGSEGQEAVGFVLVCCCVVLTGGLMVRLVHSPLAMFLALAAMATMPLAIAIEEHALEVGVFGSHLRDFQDWALWVSFVATVIFGVLTQMFLLRSRRLLTAPVGTWGRLGASLGTGASILVLAGSSSDPVIDWMAMLSSWAVTAYAVRAQRAELLPASGLLLMGSLVGGLSDLNQDPRLMLTIVYMFTAFQLTAVGLASRRVLGPLADHWLTPYWEAALLGGGVAAAGFFAAENEALGSLGIVWGLILLTAGVVRQHRLAVFFGAVGVYVPGLVLILGRWDSSLGGIIGTLIFGLLIVAGAITWRRRGRRLTLAEGDS